MIRFFTAGESHGPGLIAVLEGFPANVPIDLERVNQELFRRQQGFGRGGRMKIETDAVEIISGLRFGKTLGSPISLLLRNKDWENWREVMNQTQVFPGKEITRPRPGHADLSGAFKYGFKDMRNVLERSSARETAMRVAVGAFAKELLRLLEIRIFSHVLQIGTARVNYETIESIIQGERINEIADASPARSLDKQAEIAMVEAITNAKKEGDTLGGIVQLIIRNVPPGLGSYVHWDRKLDGQLAQALMSVQAVKGVEVGAGFSAASQPGSAFHDEMYYNKGGIVRKTNRAGGIEGGMSNGEDIVLQVFKKPIPTLMKPLHSVDVKTKKAFLAHKERSDVTAVPALSVITEAVAAPVIANAVLEKFGADSLEEIKERFLLYKERLEK